MSINNTGCRFRVIFESREHYRLMDDNKNIFAAEISGSLRKSAESWPAVGDWVSGRIQPGNWVLIENIAERKSVVARKDPGGLRPQILAANVDTLFIVTSANQDLNLSRLDRYVAMALTGEVKPVILVNKIELAESPESLLHEVTLRFEGIEVHGVSVHDKLNLEALQKYTGAGVTLALVGSSGVGKSSLTNYLLKSESMMVSNIRVDDDRGRHTTTHRELHVTEENTYIIDTPGLRSLGLTDATDLGLIFDDIQSISLKCRFSDCNHQSEPGCAVQQARASGELNEDRWQSHAKLQRELAFEKTKGNKALMSEQKKKWAKRGKEIRSRLKDKRNG